MTFKSGCSKKPIVKKRDRQCHVKAHVDGVKKQKRAYGSHTLTDATHDSLERAEKFRSELDPKFPIFIKHMTQSHVSGGFWLGLPVHFCKMYLPTHESPIILIDENMDEFGTKYLAHKTGLSGGWRGFSLQHRLVEGDTLVFQLLEQKKFKVYIFRASGTSHMNNVIYANVQNQSEKAQGRSHAVSHVRNTDNLKRPVLVEQAGHAKVNRPEASTKPSVSFASELSGPSSASVLYSDYEPETEHESNYSFSDSEHEVDDDKNYSYKNELEDKSENSLRDEYNMENNDGKSEADLSRQPSHESDTGSNVFPRSNCFQCFRFKEVRRRKAAEAEALTKDNEHLRCLMSCKVCMDRDLSILLLPCMHICSCDLCGPKLNLCPICNATKVSSIGVLFS